jgi:ABC-type sugar transport system permease subunit
MTERSITTEFEPGPALPDSSTDAPRWFLPVIALLALTAVAALVAGVLVFTGTLWGLTGIARLLVGAVLIAIAGASAVGVRDSLARAHRGRAIGVLVNYLVAIVFGFVALQNMGVFIGLDALGDRFFNAVWLLLVVALGWMLASQSDRFGSRAATVNRVGRWIAAIGGLALLVGVGFIPGLIEFFARLAALDVFIPFALAVAGGAGFWMLRRDEATALFGTTRDQAESLDGFLFASPNVLGFLAFFAGPLIFSFYVSFTSWDGLTDIQWIGLDNYARIFGLQFTSVGDGQAVADVLKQNYQELIRWGDFIIAARDRLFWVGLRNIIVFSVTAVPLAVFPGLVLAAFLNQKLPGVKFFRAVYFIPAVAGVVGISLIWKQMFNATVGFVNFGIVKLFDLINLVPGVDVVGPVPEWLSNSRVALFSVVIVFAWQAVGFNTVLFLAGMQGISASLYEAASIDGAGAWSKFWNITVPMLRPTTLFVVATTTILALQLFNEPFILFSPQQQPSGPNNATLTPVIQLYQEGFQRFNQGFASALAWVLFGIIFSITILYFRRQREDDGTLGT